MCPTHKPSHFIFISFSYPANNCGSNGVYTQAQDVFADYLNHTSATNLTLPYLEQTYTTKAAGKDIFMMEMNTASCGGFPGLSDSFGAALWLVIERGFLSVGK